MRLARTAVASVLAVLAGACAAGAPSATTPAPPRTDAALLEAQHPSLAAELAALRRRPTADAHRRAGMEFLRLRVLDQAFDHFTTAIALNPKYAAAYDARARVWREWHMLRDALDDANRAVALEPMSAEARNTLGTVLYALGIVSDAAREFGHAFGLDPTAAYAANNLCYLAFVMGDTDLAVARCQQAIGLAPDLSAARQNLALIFAATDISRAERELLAAGDPGRARYNLGILHLARREYQQAARSFSFACDERPAVRDACQRAEQARTLAKGQRP